MQGLKDFNYKKMMHHLSTLLALRVSKIVSGGRGQQDGHSSAASARAGELVEGGNSAL